MVAATQNILKSKNIQHDIQKSTIKQKNSYSHTVAFQEKQPHASISTFFMMALLPFIIQVSGARLMSFLCALCRRLLD